MRKRRVLGDPPVCRCKTWPHIVAVHLHFPSRSASVPALHEGGIRSCASPRRVEPMVKRNTGLSSTLLIQRATARVAFWRRLVRICRARFNPPASPRLSLAALSPGSIARLQQHHVRHIYQHASIAERTHNEKGRDFTCNAYRPSLAALSLGSISRRNTTPHRVDPRSRPRKSYQACLESSPTAALRPL